MHGEPVTLEGTDLMARCFQHETDHLDGVLFIDRMDLQQRKLAMKAIREADWKEAAPPFKISRTQPTGRLRRNPLCAWSSPEPRTPPCPRWGDTRSPHDVVAVVTRAGRPRRPGPQASRAPSPSSPRRRASRCSGRRAGDPAFLDRLRELDPDCCPVVAYGALLPQATLDIPRYGWVNLHFSLLPAWRGAAPVQHAVLHGDAITGAATFQIVKELDAGPVFGVVTEEIRPADTSGELLARLAESGAGLLAATLDGIEDGELGAAPQPAEGMSLAPRSASTTPGSTGPARMRVDRLVRACTPAPGPGPSSAAARQDRPGARRAGPYARLGPRRARVEHPPSGRHRTGPVELGEVQPQGKRLMGAGSGPVACALAPTNRSGWAPKLTGRGTG